MSVVVGKTALFENTAVCLHCYLKHPAWLDIECLYVALSWSQVRLNAGFDDQEGNYNEPHFST